MLIVMTKTHLVIYRPCLQAPLSQSLWFFAVSAVPSSPTDDGDDGNDGNDGDGNDGNEYSALSYLLKGF